MGTVEIGNKLGGKRVNAGHVKIELQLIKLSKKRKRRNKIENEEA